MHEVLIWTGDFLQNLSVASTLFYAAFARSWRLAIKIPLVLAFGWGICRLIAIMFFREGSPPMIGYLVLPLFCVIYGTAARLAKMLLFSMPVLSKAENVVRLALINAGIRGRTSVAFWMLVLYMSGKVVVYLGSGIRLKLGSGEDFICLGIFAALIGSSFYKDIDRTSPKSGPQQQR